VFGAELLVETLDGPVTPKEISAFKSFMQARTPASNNVGNAWVYGNSGKDTEALGLMYEVSRERGLLDEMIRFADAALAARNDPTNGRVVWTGKRELCWPNKPASSSEAAYAGSESGDVIAHIGYCAKLILQTPAIWNTPVPLGDPKGFGASYRARARTYVREMDRSIETFILPWFVKASDKERYCWPDTESYGKLGPRYESARGQPIPWNQQTMLSGGLLRLAECHELLGDEPVRVARYYRIVRSNLDWFLGDLHSGTRDGRTVYDWGYSLGRRGEDVPHGGYDIWGLCRAFENPQVQVPPSTMTGFATTLRYVIYDSTNKVFNMRVDGSNPGTKRPRSSIGGTWLGLAEHLTNATPDLYHVLADADRNAAKTKPLEAAFILSAKHRRHTQALAAAANPASR
jgi:hypothetical protein